MLARLAKPWHSAARSRMRGAISERVPAICQPQGSGFASLVGSTDWRLLYRTFVLTQGSADSGPQSPCLTSAPSSSIVGFPRAKFSIH